MVSRVINDEIVLLPIDESPTDTTTLGQSEPRINSNKGEYSTIPKASRLESQHQM